MTKQIFKKWFVSYGNLLQRRPILTQSLQTGVLMGFGDLIAQTVIEKTKFVEVDLKRTAPYAAAGLLTGPAGGSWFRYLEDKLGSGKPTVKVLVKKLVSDQLIMTPCYIGFLVCSMNFIKRLSFVEIQEYLKNNYFDILLTNYKIWPLVQLVNFYFVPLHFRVVVVQSVSVVWNTYLSWRIFSKDAEVKTE